MTGNKPATNCDHRGRLRILLGAGAASIALCLVPSARAQDNSATPLKGTWSVTVEPIRGEPTSGTVTCSPEMEQVCQRTGEGLCIWRWQTTAGGRYQASGSPRHIDRGYNMIGGSQAGGGSVVLKHSYFPNTEVEEQLLYDGSTMTGVWSMNGELMGRSSWRREPSAISRFGFSEVTGYYDPQEVTSFAPGQALAVEGEYLGEFWTNEQTNAFTRPKFAIRIYGTNMDGVHTVEFPEAPEYRPDESRPITGNDGSVIGSEVAVRLWPGATPGRKRMLVDGREFMLDVRINGFPGGDQDDRQNAGLRITMPDTTAPSYADVFPSGWLYVDVANTSNEPVLNARLQLQTSIPAIDRATAQGMNCAANYFARTVDCTTQVIAPRSTVRVGFALQMPEPGLMGPLDSLGRYRDALAIGADASGSNAGATSARSELRFHSCSFQLGAVFEGAAFQRISQFARESEPLNTASQDFISERGHPYSFDDNLTSQENEMARRWDAFVREAAANRGPDNALRDARGKYLDLYRQLAGELKQAIANGGDRQLVLRDSAPAREIAALDAALDARWRELLSEYGASSVIADRELRRYLTRINDVGGTMDTLLRMTRDERSLEQQGQILPGLRALREDIRDAEARGAPLSQSEVERRTSEIYGKAGLPAPPGEALRGMATGFGTLVGMETLGLLLNEGLGLAGVGAGYTAAGATLGHLDILFSLKDIFVLTPAWAQDMDQSSLSLLEATGHYGLMADRHLQHARLAYALKNDLSQLALQDTACTPLLGER